MEKTVHCPKCGSVVLKQIEPVHGRIQVVCAGCRTSLFMTFEHGKLIAIMYKDRGEREK